VNFLVVIEVVKDASLDDGGFALFKIDGYLFKGS
jgi:hypothetical protein